MFFKYVFLLMFVGLFGLPPGSAAAAVAPEIVHTRYALPQNGLEVILAPDHSLPVVAVNVWYHAGPANEPPQRTGFAHLFEHLMFQGSKNVGDDGHFKYLERSGASSINGTTSNDRTNYFETVPSNQLALALWLESDRMGFLRPNLTQKNLDNQRQVVKNERRQSIENVPYGPSREALAQALFPAGHPYHGYVIGSHADLDKVDLGDVLDFYEQFYAPANATLAVAGDFDEDEAKVLIDKYFGSLPRRDAPKAVEVVTDALTQERALEIAEPVQLSRVSMGWHSPVAYSDADAVADVLAFILGSGKSSRLYQALIYEQQLASRVSASQQSQFLSSVFEISAIGRPGVDAGRLQKAIDEQLKRLVSSPPSAVEVNRARNMLVTSSLSGLQRVGARADMLNRYNHYKDLGRYDAVSADAVLALAKKLLRRESRAIVVTVPK